jgi:predicted NAD-dependent protein-ADP-ribosyltransferase YbiA (DUF1768 family)
MNDFATFLRARLDEDEALAREAPEGPWHIGNAVDPTKTCNVHTFPGARLVADGLNWLVAEHIARHNPARVLRDIEARRALLALHEPHQQPGRYSDVNDRATWMTCCSMCQVDMVQEGDWPCETLRLLALSYADHPDYRQEWRP